MRDPLKVYVLGGDLGGWALDTELRLAKQALSTVKGVTITESLGEADVLHTVWPEQLVEKESLRDLWRGKRVVASFSNDPLALFERVPGLYEAARDWICVGQSSLAVSGLRSVGIPRIEQIAYRADEGSFYPISQSDSRLHATRKKLGIPENAYVIGFFQRDSEGSNLSKPKVQKAPDFFASIMKEVYLSHPELHVLLAGPRRHWLRGELARLGIPFSFYGECTEDDDYPHGIISKEEMNLLVNCCDLNLVTSRWEGAPRALMECVAAEKKVISTPVGIAGDLLEPYCLFADLPSAVTLVLRDIRENLLSASIAPQKRRLEEQHGLSAVTAGWQTIYDRISPPETGRETNQKTHFHFVTKISSVATRIRRKIPLFTPMRKVAWVRKVHEPDSPQAQLDDALAQELRRIGCLTDSTRTADILLADGAPELVSAIPAGARMVLHRWGGPDAVTDDIQAWNGRFATHTLFSTLHDWVQAVQSGFKPRRPRIVRSSLFLAQSSPVETQNAGIIAVVGNREIPELAKIPRLERHHSILREGISRSSALLLLDDGAEARLAALYAAHLRIPALYPAESGVSEICGFCGLSYANDEDIPARLQSLFSHLEGLRLTALSPDPAETLLRYVTGKGDLL